MKKLLHERLRNGEIKLPNSTCLVGESFDHFCKKLADEIERCYIPRPRFEDGESIDIGDETQFGKIYGLKYDGNIWDMIDDEGFNHPCWCLKRPSLKVLDADGVEIKVGDTVWSKGGAEYIVEKIEDEDCIYLRRPFEDKALVKMTARCLIHGKPGSLEKLRNDVAELWERLYNNETRAEIDEFADRLSALIEKVG